MKKIRCAIYTRKRRTKKGLEQEFNVPSMRSEQACAAYVDETRKRRAGC